MQVVYKPWLWTPPKMFRDAVQYAIDAMCLEEIPGTLTIECKSKTGKEMLGDSYYDGIDEYTIRLWTLDLSTLFHEMVHVMQYANYELEVYGEGHGYWQGQTIKGLTYETSPWEIEAYHIEQILLKCFNAQREKNS